MRYSFVQARVALVLVLIQAVLCLRCSLPLATGRANRLRHQRVLEFSKTKLRTALIADPTEGSQVNLINFCAAPASADPTASEAETETEAQHEVETPSCVDDNAESAAPICSVEERPPVLSFSRPVEYGVHLKLKGAVLNLWGVMYALSLLANALLLLPSLFLLTVIADVTGDTKRRRLLDWLVHYWARLSLKLPNLLLFNSPTLYGEHNLPPPEETVVYVPNHTTFFDILLLSGYIPRPFKYLSKIEISRIPMVGLAMKLARHVFLDRRDVLSAAHSVEEVHQRLLDGNSMALFAEGTRSADGRLRPFKKGAFQMAKRAGVRVVPVSVAHLHRIMPSEALMPLTSLNHTYIMIHPPIETADKTVKEIQNECFEAINSGLPDYQKYKQPNVTTVANTSSTTHL